MNRIEEMIREMCPEGVRRVKLKETCEIKTGKGITQKEADTGGQFPIISGGIEPMGMYRLSNRAKNTVTISRVGANAGFVNYITDDFYLNDKCFSVIPTTIDITFDTKYLFYFLKQKERDIRLLQSEGGVPTINTQKIGSIEIPLPPLPIQQEIVNILDKFTSLQQNLEDELKLRQKQYEYYCDKLYGGDYEGMMNMDGVDGAKVVKLADLGTITRGKRFVRDDVREKGQPCIHYGDMYTYYGTKAKTTKTHLDRNFPKKMRYAKKGDVVIVGAGENNYDIGVGLVWMGDEPAAVHDACYILEHSINPMYISYFLRSSIYHLQLKKFVSEGKICSFSGTDLGRILIPIQSSDKQSQIVQTLDHFESLISNIKTEIELRKKQYEFYREKLLTF